MGAIALLPETPSCSSPWFSYQTAHQRKIRRATSKSCKAVSQHSITKLGRPEGVNPRGFRWNLWSAKNFPVCWPWYNQYHATMGILWTEPEPPYLRACLPRTRRVFWPRVDSSRHPRQDPWKQRSLSSGYVVYICRYNKKPFVYTHQLPLPGIHHQIQGLTSDCQVAKTYV